MNRPYSAAKLAQEHIPDTDWPTVDLLTAGGLDKVRTTQANGQNVHRLFDRRTGQAWGAPGVTDAARMGLALARLNGLSL